MHATRSDQKKKNTRNKKAGVDGRLTQSMFLHLEDHAINEADSCTTLETELD
jgi:hypothetical protein